MKQEYFFVLLGTGYLGQSQTLELFSRFDPDGRLEKITSKKGIQQTPLSAVFEKTNHSIRLSSFDGTVGLEEPYKHLFPLDGLWFFFSSKQNCLSHQEDTFAPQGRWSYVTKLKPLQKRVPLPFLSLCTSGLDDLTFLADFHAQIERRFGIPMIFHSLSTSFSYGQPIPQEWYSCQFQGIRWLWEQTFLKDTSLSSL